MVKNFLLIIRGESLSVVHPCLSVSQSVSHTQPVKPATEGFSPLLHLGWACQSRKCLPFPSLSISQLVSQSHLASYGSKLLLCLLNLISPFLLGRLSGTTRCYQLCCPCQGLYIGEATYNLDSQFPDQLQLLLKICKTNVQFTLLIQKLENSLTAKKQLKKYLKETNYCRDDKKVCQ